MPFCMFFYHGYAMHASYLPGYHASHGCIRLFYEDAEWLNKNFVDMGRRGTKVIVQSLNELKTNAFNAGEEILSCRQREDEKQVLSTLTRFEEFYR